MKISNQQLHYLMIILKETISGTDIKGMFTINYNDRANLLREIISQQDRAIVELDDLLKQNE